MTTKVTVVVEDTETGEGLRYTYFNAHDIDISHRDEVDIDRVWWPLDAHVGRLREMDVTLHLTARRDPSRADSFADISMCERLPRPPEETP